MSQLEFSDSSRMAPDGSRMDSWPSPTPSLALREGAEALRKAPSCSAYMKNAVGWVGRDAPDPCPRAWSLKHPYAPKMHQPTRLRLGILSSAAAVVLALGTGAWGRASFFALCPCASEFRWSRPRRKDSPYRGGRSPDWLKMKNPACAAVKREAVELRRPIPSYRPRAQLASRSSL